MRRAVASCARSNVLVMVQVALRFCLCLCFSFLAVSGGVMLRRVHSGADRERAMGGVNMQKQLLSGC